MDFHYLLEYNKIQRPWVFSSMSFDNHIHPCNPHQNKIPFPIRRESSPILPSQFPYLCNHFLIFIAFVRSWISHKWNIFKIPLYCLYTNNSFFFLKIDELYSIVWMYQHLLISPAVNRRSGCFQLGTIINKGAINILTSFCEHVFFPLPKYLGVEFLAYSRGYT